MPAARTRRAGRHLAGAAECMKNRRADLARRNVWEALALYEFAVALPEFAELAGAPTAGGCGRKFGPPDLRCRVRRPDRRRREQARRQLRLDYAKEFALPECSQPR